MKIGIINHIKCFLWHIWRDISHCIPRGTWFRCNLLYMNFPHCVVDNYSGNSNAHLFALFSECQIIPQVKYVLICDVGGSERRSSCVLIRSQFFDILRPGTGCLVPVTHWRSAVSQKNGTATAPLWKSKSVFPKPFGFKK